MRAAYLGPPGTNSHAALAAALAQAGDRPADVEAVAAPTIAAVVAAVQDGSAERALVPLENSREGGVGATVDALVFDAPDVEIVGDVIHHVTYTLVAEEPIEPDEVRTVHSHPQALGQCGHFLRTQLPGAALVPLSSTAEAVRAVAQGEPLPGAPPHAAIGTAVAAQLYGAAVLAEGIEDDRENATRFAWLAHRDAGARAAGGTADSAPGGQAWKTTLVFWGAGDLAPGWLVTCLTEFSSRGVNLTRIESRPRRVGLGHYMFVCDLLGDAQTHAVAAALDGLRRHCEVVRVLGSFPAAA